MDNLSKSDKRLESVKTQGAYCLKNAGFVKSSSTRFTPDKDWWVFFCWLDSVTLSPSRSTMHVKCWNDYRSTFFQKKMQSLMEKLLCFSPLDHMASRLSGHVNPDSVNSEFYLAVRIWESK